MTASRGTNVTKANAIKGHPLVLKSKTRIFALCLGITLLLPACTTPSLVQIARERAAANTPDPSKAKNDPRLEYQITDVDVLNFTDAVKRQLSARSRNSAGIRYTSATAQATLSGLAGAAKTIGWGTATASGYGLAATYVFGLSSIFDSKGRAQAYEQAFTAVEKSEANFYFHRTGMKFVPSDGGKWGVEGGKDTSGIPSSKYLSTDGETLFYRVTKTLGVLNDTLAGKIPNLQDLKDSQGDTSGSSKSPTKGT